ncbi:MAG TPA: hypothetical protein PKA41_09095 [Verrucomicrobiota bacterium]|nr:hypothetical protein [Verrucomicrobiota bacterium]
MSADNRNTNYPEGQSDAAELCDARLLYRGRTPDDDPSPEQIAILRQMSPGRRLEIAEQMYWSARRMKAAWLRTLHPDWSDAEVEAEVTRIFSHARS